MKTHIISKKSLFFIVVSLFALQIMAEAAGLNSVINSPAAGEWLVSDTQINVTDFSQATDCKYHVYDYDANVWTKSYANRTCNSLFTVTVGPSGDCRSEGLAECIVYVFNRDNSGNYSDPYIYEYNVDYTNPATYANFTGTEGVNGWYISDVIAALACNDTGSGCNVTKYCVDQLNACDPQTSYTSSVSVSQEGKSYIRFNSIDNVNKTEMTTSQEIKIDKTNPSVSISASSTNVTNEQPIAISATASDTNLDSVNIYVDNVLVKTCSLSLCIHNSTFSTGTHNYYASANDKSGRNALTSQGSFSVTNRNPTLSVTVFPTIVKQNDIITIRGTVSDPDRDGVAMKCGPLPDFHPVTSPVISYPYSQQAIITDTIPLIENGPKTIYCIATDGTTNSTEENMTIIIDNSQPNVSISQSPSVVGPQTAVTLTASATNNVSGIANIKIYVDSSLVQTCTSSSCYYTNTYNSGTHNYYATTQSNSGITQTTSSSSFTVDTTAPAMGSIEITSQKSGNFVKSPLDIRTAVSDSSGIDNTSCQYEIDSTWLNAQYQNGYCIKTGILVSDNQHLNINFRVKDVVGNTATISASLIADNSGPVSSISIEGNWFNSATLHPFLISCQSSDYLSGVSNYTIEQSSDNINWVTLSNQNPSNTINWNWDNTGSSDKVGWYFRCLAQDNLGNIGQYSYASIVGIDVTRPFSNSTSPQYVNSGDIRIDYNASDATSGVKETELIYRLNSGAWQNPEINSTNGTLYFSPNQDGVYYFYTIAKDNAKNSEVKSTADTQTVYDTTPPASSVATTGYFNALSYPGISGNASDATSGVSYVDIIIQRPDGKYWNGNIWVTTPYYLRANGTISWTYAFAPTDGVTYTVKSRSTDLAGNVQSSLGTNTFTFDNTGPVVTVTYPTIGVFLAGGSQQTITWTAINSNLGSNPITIEFSTDGTTWQTVAQSVSGSQYAWNVPAVNTDTARIRVNATDLAGNTGSGTSSLFSIDSVKPQIISAVTNDSNANGKIDSIILQFSEEVTIVDGNSNDSLPGFSVSGYNLVNSDYSAVNTTLLTLMIQESGSDTDSTPAVAYANSSLNILDRANNAVPSIVMISTDGSALRMTSAYTFDLNHNGRIDGMNVTFSEDIAPSSIAAIDFSVSGHSVTMASRTSPKTVTVIFSEGSSTDTNSLPSLFVVGQVDDMAVPVNTANDGNITPGDRTEPIVSVNAPSSAGVGNAVVTLTFSEVMEASNPVVTFGTTTPFSANILSGSWINSTVWQGSSPVSITTGDGINRISVSGARDQAGNQILTNTSGTFFIDTVAPVISIQNPLNQTYVSQLVPLAFTTADVSGVAGCTREVDGSNTTGCSNTTLTLADGTHIIKVFSTDTLNNTGASSITLTVDTTSPIVAIQSPLNQTYASQSVPLNFIVSDVSGILTCSREVDSVNTIGCGNATLTLSEGVHIVKVFSTDSYGNTGSSQINLTVDTTSPAITIQTPLNQTYATQSIPLAFTSTDVSGIASCSREIDGSNTTSCANVTMTLTDGPHTIKIFSTDNYGNRGSSQISLTIDTTASIVTIQNPLNQTYSTQSIPLSFTATDVSGISTCFREIDGTNTSGCSNVTLTLSDGPHTIKIFSTDNYGNTGSSIVRLTVDTTGPVVAMQNPLNQTYATHQVPINFIVSDISGISACSREIDGTNTTGCYNTTATLTDGIHAIKVFSTDNYGNAGSAIVQLTVDTTGPTVTIQNPLNQTYSTQSIPLTFTSTDVSGIASCSREIDGSNTTSCSNTTLTLLDGLHIIKVYSTDNYGNTDLSVVRLTVDTTSPTVAIQNPLNQTYAISLVPLTFTSTDVSGIASCSREIDGSNTTNCANVTITLTDGPHIIKIFSTDSYGNTGYTQLGLTVDTTPPFVAIQNPINQTYASQQVSLQFITYDISGVSTCSREIDGSNTTSCANVTMTLSDGPHTIKIFSTDNYGNTGSAIDRFTVDTTGPTVAIQSLLNQTYAVSSVLLAFTALDVSGVSTCSREIDGSNTTGCNNITLTLTDGFHTIKIFSTDNYGNVGSTQTDLTIDTMSPTVTIQNPLNQTYAASSVSLTFTAADISGVADCSREIDGLNATGCSNVTLTLPDGPHIVRIFLTDNYGNTGYTQLGFTVDTTGPNVTVQTPLNQTYASRSVPLAFTTSDVSGIASCSREVDGINTTNCANVTLTLLDGPHTIKIFSTDNYGNIASSLVRLTVDTTSPTVTIQNPLNLTYANQSVALNFIVSDISGISTCFREIDGSNITSCLNVTLALSDGPHTIKIFSTDSYTNVGFSQIDITVDTTSPTVAIQTPLNQTYSTQSVPLAFTASDVSGIASCSREIDGSNTSSCTNVTLTLSDSTHTIKIFSTDNYGNTASSLVRLTVDITGPTVAIQNPLNQTYAVSSVPLAFTASDVSGIASCTREVDGTNTSSCPNVTLTLLDGPHTIKIFSTDNYGNIGSSQTRLTIDTTSPVVTIQNPLNQTYSTQSVPLAFIATDISGIASCFREIDGANTTSCLNVTLSLIDGLHTIKIFSTDNYGNTGYTQLGLTVDTTGPNVTIENPLNQTYTTHLIPLTFTTWDISGVLSCSTEIDKVNSTAGCLNTTLTIADGLHEIRVHSTDVYGNLGTTTVNLTVDTTGPTVAIQNPLNQTYAVSSVPLAFTAIDVSGVSGCSREVDGVNSSGCANVTLTLADGSHKVKIFSTDNYGNSDSSSIGFTVDTTSPAITIQNPLNQTYAIKLVPLAFTATDISGISACSREIDGSNTTSCANVTLTLSDGLHKVKIFSTDTANNTGMVSIDLTIDTTGPNVAIQTPLNQTYSTQSVPLAFTASDVSGIASCSREIDSINTSSCANVTLTLSDGLHKVKIFSTDNYGNLGSSEINLTVDTTGPTVAIQNPLNQTYSTQSIPLAFTASDVSGISGCSREIDSINTSSCNNITLTLSDGPHMIKIFSTDNFGNNAYLQISVTVDTTAPTVAIQNPLNQTYSSHSVPLAFTATDVSGVSSCSFETDGTNTSGCSNITMTLADGLHQVKVFSTDNYGNTGSSSINLTVDTTGPTVAIQNPLNQTYSSHSVPLAFTATDVSGVSTCSKEIDGVNVSGCLNATLSLTDGLHMVKIFATDSYGNVVSSQVNLTIDTTVPTVTIQNPLNQTYASQFISFAFTAWDLSGISGCSREIDSINTSSCNNITLTLSDGPHMIKIFSVDNYGNTGSAQINLTVDTSSPTVTIQNPLNQTYASQSVPLNFIVSDLSGISSCSREVDGINTTGCSNITLSLIDGNHTIKIFSTDSYGNAGFSQVILTVDTTFPTVTIQNPLNQTYASQSVPLNFIVSDLSGISSCSREIDSINTSSCSNTTLILTDGLHTVKIFSTDNLGNIGVSQVNLTVDTTFPTVAIQNPLNQTYASQSVPLAFTATDISGILTCSKEIDGTNTSGCSNVTLTLSDGPHTIKVFSTDSYGNVGLFSINLTVDTTSPTMSIENPINKTYSNQFVPLTFVTWDISGISSCTREIDGTNISGCSNVTLSLIDGNHTIKIFSTDNYGNAVTSSVNLMVDSMAPILVVQSPQNMTYAQNQIMINYTTYDVISPVGCVILLDGMTIPNKTDCSNFTLGGFLTSNGPHSITILSNDTANNTAISQINFTVDTFGPMVAISSPSGAYNLSAVYLNFSAWDVSGLGKCSYELDGTTNVSVSCLNNSLIPVSDGIHNIKVWANDTYDNSNATAISFMIDTVVPQFSVTPISGGYNTTQIVTVNATDTNLDKIAVYVNNAVYAISNTAVLFNLTDGIYSIYAIINDTAGNINATGMTNIQVDTVKPSLVSSSLSEGNGTLYSPVNKDSNFDTLGFTIQLSENASWSRIYVYNSTGSQVKYFTISGTPANVSRNWDLNLTLTSKDWANDGDYIINTTITDLFGNMNDIEVARFRVDNDPPAITISSPSNTTYVSIGIPFTYSITDANTYTCNATIDGLLTDCNNLMISDLQPGLHNLTLGTSDAALNRNETTVMFTVNLSNTVNGYILDAYVNKISNALVEIRQGDSVINSTVSLTDGSYTLRVPSSTYSIYAFKTGYLENLTNNVVINLSSTKMNITLPSIGNATISGYVIDNDGNKLFNTLVEIKQGNSTIKSMFTDENGNYSFSLPAGNYIIKAVKTGFNIYQNDFSAAISQNILMNAIMNASQTSGSVSGTVYNNVFSTVSTAKVDVYINGNLFQVVYSNPSGIYKVNGLPIIYTYDINATAPGYSNIIFGQQNIAVANGATSTGKDIVIGP